MRQKSFLAVYPLGTRTISWAGMIAGYAQNGRSEQALVLLQSLHRNGMLPSLSSLTSSLFACSNIEALETGKQVHSLAVKAGCQYNSYVSNALITIYVCQVQNHRFVRQIFDRMHNNMLEQARDTFDNMHSRNAVSWTTTIFACAQADQGNEAVEVFKSTQFTNRNTRKRVLLILKQWKST